MYMYANNNLKGIIRGLSKSKLGERSEEIYT